MSATVREKVYAVRDVRHARRAAPLELWPTCVYCGEDASAGPTCGEHRDLVDSDANYPHLAVKLSTGLEAARERVYAAAMQAALSGEDSYPARERER